MSEIDRKKFFLYRLDENARLTEEDLAQNPKGELGPLSNRQIDANFNSVMDQIEKKSDLVDPVYPKNSLVDINNGFLLIPIFSDDDIPEEGEIHDKILKEGSFRFNPKTFALETYHENKWQSLTAKAAGGSGNSVFWLNDQSVTADFTVPANKNALTAGPITIERGVTVSIADGSTWTVV